METAVENDREVNEVLQPRLAEVAALKKNRGVSRLGILWKRLNQWETWDWRIKYILLAPVWAWYCAKARSPWFFTAANPSLTFGGFDGESKMEMYEQLPPGTYPQSVLISPDMHSDEVCAIVARSGLSFPVAVKPDVGKMGLMFRRINTQEQLHDYHRHMECPYIVQEFVSYPLELSVFYYRMPEDRHGTVTGFVRKDFLEVTGDGQSTLWDLIVTHPRAQFRLKEMRSKHKEKLDCIVPTGHRYCLSPALNLSRGGRLVSLEDEKDKALVNIFDNISHYNGNFLYGRYDVKCESVNDLKHKRNFSILEYNGSGAEPHHVYGNGYTLWEACGILVHHWKMLYRISRANHKKGVVYWDFSRGLRFMNKTSKYLERLRRLDRKFPVS